MTPQRSRRPQHSRIVAGLTGLALLTVTACSAGNAPGAAGESGATPSAPAASAAAPSTPAPTGKPRPAAPRVSVTPADGTTMVNPVDAMTVTTDRGKLETVSVVSDGGVEATGKLSEDGRTWTATKPLQFDAFYTVTYTADNNGRRTEASSTFSTVDAAHEMDVSLNVKNGESYGLWQVVEFEFSEPVANRAAIEKAVIVTGGGDSRGAFRWYSDTKLRYRPEKPWAANSTVKVTANLLGKDAGNGMIGNENETVTFTTGGEHRAYVDNDKKTLVAYVDGKKSGEWPVTLGNEDWPSTTGKKVILEQAASYPFKPSSLDLKPGDPHYYEPFDASNVSRLTWSGEFIHQALPSAQPILGQANVSHGCVGMPPDGAKYILDTFQPGDMVEVVNTGYAQANPDDGYGDWNIPFKNYSDENWKGNW